MTPHPVGQLDWNSLAALHALLSERSVGRAARRLSISQPAASGALAKLRRKLGDELLHRHGNQYDLTPLATRLLPLVCEAVSAAQRVVDAAQHFDPRTSTREFRVMMSDYAQIVFGAELAAAVKRAAPFAHVSLLPLRVDPGAGWGNTVAGLDGVVLPRGICAGLGATDLFADRWVCLASSDNDAVGDLVTTAMAARMAWVGINSAAGELLPQFEQVRMHGIDLDFDLVTESFSALPFLVAGTSRLALVQERLGRRLAGAAGVRLVEFDAGLAPLNMALMSSPELEFDAAHRWLCDLAVATAGAALDPELAHA